jgi:hypothetical protein
MMSTAKCRSDLERLAMDDREYLRSELEVQRRRLRHLEMQAAQFGLHVPPYVQLDLDDTRKRVADLESQLAQREEGKRLPDTIPCPYPGMKPFQAKDARFFYGREREIIDLLLCLRNQRYLLVIGPSGSGKSSLVFAGLLPRLCTSGYFSEGEWLVRDMHPGSQPLQAITTVLGGDIRQLDQALTDLLDAGPPAQRLLLVVDQFEELFTQSQRAEQSRFIGILKELRKLERCALLLTMRADFYPELMSSDLWPVELAERVEIAPLRAEALAEVIERPAKEVGVRLEKGLLDQLIADAANEPGVLPLIQETMNLLWPNMRVGELTLDAYKRLGSDGRSGLAVAVAKKANGVLSDLTDTQKEIARRIFLSLVKPGEGGPDTRRQRALKDLRGPRNDCDFDYTLRHLTDERLLTLRGDDSEQGPMVDLAHEVLITGWPQLRKWLNDHRANLLLHERLRANVREWLEHQRDRSFLYGGARLNDAEHYANMHPLDLSETETEFLKESRTREGIRERARYIGQAAGGALGAAVGYGLAFALGFWDTNNGDVAATLIMFLVMSPFGALVGFCIGIGLWLNRASRPRRMVANGFIGALASSVSYVTALWFSSPGGTELTLLHLAVGAVLGAGLGTGAALTNTRRRYLLGATLGGVFAAGFAFVLGGLQWAPLTTLFAGLVLGALTGLGFQVTAVENDELLFA